MEPAGAGVTSFGLFYWWEIPDYLRTYSLYREHHYMGPKHDSPTLLPCDSLATILVQGDFDILVMITSAKIGEKSVDCNDSDLLN